MYTPIGGNFRGFRSLHPGGAHFAMGDASVQFITEGIDHLMLSCIVNQKRWRGCKRQPIGVHKVCAKKNQLVRIAKVDAVKSRESWHLVLLIVFVIAIGCGPKSESTVSGNVTVDGTPLDHGTIMFVPVSGGKGMGATAQIQGDGSYSIRIGSLKGLPAGSYKVKVSARAPSIPSRGGGPPAPGKLLTPKKYRVTSTSGLQFDVARGRNKIDLELNSD